jgi:glycosyltransferase involved in cell wall biosynthesis
VHDQITPLIITFNEAPNIARTVGKLSWAKRIVVIDSGSTDETLDMLRSFPQVDVIAHPFSDFASQCNFGLAQVGTPWVLSLDADYEISDALVEELAGLRAPAAVAGYQARFVYRIYVLYRKDKARYRNEGHGHRVAIDGEILPLSGVVYHDDRKPLARWFDSQRRYAQVEARYLFETPAAKLTRNDRIRHLGWLAPIGVLFYTLFVKGCILDGWP